MWNCDVILLPCTSDKFIKIFSEANFAIPYGSTGSGKSFSFKCYCISPYLAIEEQCTILFTFAEIAALNTETEPLIILEVIVCGENIKPSWAYAAV